MLVDLERLRGELEAACADAAVDPGTLVVWIVDAVRPPGTTPVAYLHPDGEVKRDTVAVFRAVGAERAGEWRGRAHRLALWRELPGLPDAALGPMLRHELEHARRWERSGSAFFDADERLRKATPAAGYASIPSEAEANAAAAAYAHATLTPAQLAELAAVPELEAVFAATPVVPAFPGAAPEPLRPAAVGPAIETVAPTTAA